MYEASQSSANGRQTGAGWGTGYQDARPKGTFTQFGARHIKGVAIIRAVVALWLVCLGVILCANGHWWAASLFAIAAVVGWLAYQVPKWNVGRW
jgi:hypothetical protein